MRTFLFIGGGAEDNLDVLRWAKEAGLMVAISDRDAVAPGVGIADRVVNVDATDVAGLCCAVLRQKWAKTVVGVYTAIEAAEPGAAMLARLLGVGYPSVRAVLAASDKVLAHRAFGRVQGVSSPQWWSPFKTAKGAKRVFIASDLPLVVKPSRASGSVGVRIVRSLDALEGAIEDALRYGPDVLVERYVEGTFHEVNGIMWKGAFYECGVSDSWRDGVPVPSRGRVPSALPEDVAAKLYEATRRAAVAVGIHYGPVKSDIILADAGPVIMEVSARFHGNVITVQAAQVAYDQSPLRMWIRTLAGLETPHHLVPSGKVVQWRAEFTTPDYRDNRDLKRYVFTY